MHLIALLALILNRQGASVGATPKILQSAEGIFNKVTEKDKVLQTIASVIEALPPASPIPPVEVRSLSLSLIAFSIGS